MAEAETAGCRLYLIVPPLIYLPRLEAALSGGDVACLLLRKSRAGAPHGQDLARSIISLAHGQNIAALVEDDAALAKEAGADGVHLSRPDAAALRQARDSLGEDGIMGVFCGTSRHDAMVMAEQGADYVGFGGEDGAPHDDYIAALAALAGWWSELFETPAAAWHRGFASAAQTLAGAGADFVAVEHGVWGDFDGPRAAVREFTAALVHRRQRLIHKRWQS